jgi:hypothetical protein
MLLNHLDLYVPDITATRQEELLNLARRCRREFVYGEPIQRHLVWRSSQNLAMARESSSN